MQVRVLDGHGLAAKDVKIEAATPGFTAEFGPPTGDPSVANVVVKVTDAEQVKNGKVCVLNVKYGGETRPVSLALQPLLGP